jgi:Na+/proline symporter
MFKKMMLSAFCFAIALTPATVSAGAFGDNVVTESDVTEPQDTAVAPVVGNLSGGWIAGAVVLALVAVASSGGSTSSTNGTN